MTRTIVMGISAQKIATFVRIEQRTGRKTMAEKECIPREAALQFVFDACAECMDACEEFDGIYADCNQCMLEGVKLKLRDLPAADVVPASDFRDCRNELCLKCGAYTQKHNGACDGCRWR